MNVTGMNGHRVTLEWMGQDVDTLADLFPNVPRAICVGINPAPKSVDAGHYYQGRLGQQFFGRLEVAGFFTAPRNEFHDDAAVAAGIGFTDLVKRPTRSASELSRTELSHGTRLLAEKLLEQSCPVIILPFKKAAVALCGTFDGNGWLDRTFAGSRLFVMPGPYENSATASATIASLLPGL